MPAFSGRTIDKELIAHEIIRDILKLTFFFVPGIPHKMKTEGVAGPILFPYAHTPAVVFALLYSFYKSRRLQHEEATRIEERV